MQQPSYADLEALVKSHPMYPSPQEDRLLCNLIINNHQQPGLIIDAAARERIVHIARSMAVKEGIRIGLTSRHTRHLQYDPLEQGKFIGVNPRCMYAFLSHTVITTRILLDAIEIVMSPVA